MSPPAGFPALGRCSSMFWNSNHILGAHACFLISLCLLFASVGQASARTIASLPWTLFTSLLTHRLVHLCIDAPCFIFWHLPGLQKQVTKEQSIGSDKRRRQYDRIPVPLQRASYEYETARLRIRTCCLQAADQNGPAHITHDSVSSFGICQGMSWQHLNQPWGWIGVILLSSLSLTHNQQHIETNTFLYTALNAVHARL